MWERAFPYRLVRRLPDEGPSEVYEAQSLELPLRRRVKLLKPTSELLRQQTQERWGGLARLAERRRCVYLDLPVSSGLLPDERPWLAFGQLEAKPLGSVVKARGLPRARELVLFAQGLAEGMSWLHHRGCPLGAISSERLWLEVSAWDRPVLRQLEREQPGPASSSHSPSSQESSLNEMNSLGLLLLALMNASLPAPGQLPELPAAYECFVPIIDRLLSEDAEERFGDPVDLCSALHDEVACAPEPRSLDALEGGLLVTSPELRPRPLL